MASRDLCWERVFSPGVQASVEDVGDVAFERAACFASGFPSACSRAT
jgi:hypothetical protein